MKSRIVWTLTALVAIGVCILYWMRSTPPVRPESNIQTQEPLSDLRLHNAGSQIPSGSRPPADPRGFRAGDDLQPEAVPAMPSASPTGDLVVNPATGASEVVPARESSGSVNSNESNLSISDIGFNPASGAPMVRADRESAAARTKQRNPDMKKEDESAAREWPPNP